MIDEMHLNLQILFTTSYRVCLILHTVFLILNLFWIHEFIEIKKVAHLSVYFTKMGGVKIIPEIQKTLFLNSGNKYLT